MNTPGDVVAADGEDGRSLDDAEHNTGCDAERRSSPYPARRSKVFFVQSGGKVAMDASCSYSSRSRPCPTPLGSDGDARRGRPAHA